MDQLSFFNNSEGLLFPENLLDYYPGFIDPEKGMNLLAPFIKTIPWQQQTVMMYGKEILTPRLTAWFGGRNYGNSSGAPVIPWTSELMGLKQQIEEFTRIRFNSLLLNYYRDGNDSVAWQSDNEKGLGERPDIASLSLGQSRRFDFRSKINPNLKHSLNLANGTLLIMRGDLQKNWEHRIAKSSIPLKPRINLTFRTVN